MQYMLSEIKIQYKIDYRGGEGYAGSYNKRTTFKKYVTYKV